MTPAALKRLLRRAAAAARRAHCPYSHYHVGAALLGPGQRMYAGCNVENASYGLTLCAERNAVVQAVAAGIKTFSAVAIVADGPAIPFPCGACRQVLVEFCGPDTIVIIAVRNRLDQFQTLTLGKLLPHAFTL
ncbi:MAG: cytidine deaminase [Verrucomicrobia bacterium]|nr:cytidine deaminase [Verrucomicrobiota bacterium]